MFFSFQNAAFVEALKLAARNIRRSTLRQPAPKALYHYTSEAGLTGIIQNRNVWATCITAQSDLTELNHGISLTEQIVFRLGDQEPNSFIQRVLTEIPEFMRTRRHLFFITCFCGSQSSQFHWENYGDYCLKFDIPEKWEPTLRCSDTRAEHWY